MWWTKDVDPSSVSCFGGDSPWKKKKNIHGTSIFQTENHGISGHSGSTEGPVTSKIIHRFWWKRRKDAPLITATKEEIQQLMVGFIPIISPLQMRGLEAAWKILAQLVGWSDCLNDKPFSLWHFVAIKIPTKRGLAVRYATKIRGNRASTVR